VSGCEAHATQRPLQLHAIICVVSQHCVSPASERAAASACACVPYPAMACTVAQILTSSVIMSVKTTTKRSERAASAIGAAAAAEAIVICM
jgi:hypothetical protein